MSHESSSVCSARLCRATECVKCFAWILADAEAASHVRLLFCREGIPDLHRTSHGLHRCDCCIPAKALASEHGLPAKGSDFMHVVRRVPCACLQRNARAWLAISSAALRITIMSVKWLHEVPRSSKRCKEATSPNSKEHVVPSAQIQMGSMGFSRESCLEHRVFHSRVLFWISNKSQEYMSNAR